ncbi:hypothetical protein N9B82_03325 [Saprospiraceae bacterium]|nr:hypothetical protein [Saprospiraceae bacterium]
MKILTPLFLVAFLFLSSCTKECVRCTLDTAIISVCEDDDTNFTDANGNPIVGYEAIIANLEGQGYTCQ